MKSVDELLSLLTVEEKVALVAGYHFMCTNPVPRLGIHAIKMSDGPHGLRAQPEGGDNGVTNSLPATCFPTASCSANTWKPELLREMGNAMAEEAAYYGVSVILGPGVNIKRNPRCGRNFEYFSEDPFLAGRMGCQEVLGIQEKGIGVSLKHFACNNAENYRFMGDSIVDERAMREIYLRQFEHIVKTAHPETVMCAYNKVNGTYCSEHDWLLNQILRDEWGFKGLVMSDWGTTHDRVKGVKSGLDLEMPGDNDICRKWLVDALADGSLSQEELDKAVKNVLTLVCNHQTIDTSVKVHWEEHHELAKKIAIEGAVLLKNEGSLPLKEKERLLVIGELFEKTRYQGAGSSMINPMLRSTVKSAFDAHHIQYQYVRGYRTGTTELEQELLDEAVETAKSHERVLLFIGLTEWFEFEGGDRKDLSLPKNQLALIDALIKENKKIDVVLIGGAPVELPFFDRVDSILNMFLSGQNNGEATYELLFGKANPSGKLAETWPLRYEDAPFGNEYALDRQDVYKESIYVGYRYYLSANKEVRFPFGYGLSYTQYDYKNLKVSQNENTIEVDVDVTNVGKVDGQEIVQVYVSAPRSNVHKPIRELKGFAKVALKSGETKTVRITLDKTDLRYWDIVKKEFLLEDGEYIIQAGKNSRDITLEEIINVKGEKSPQNTNEIYQNLRFDELCNQQYEEIFEVKIPAIPPKKPFTLDSRFSDLKASFMGKILYNSIQSVAKKEKKKARKMPEGVEKENRIKGAEFLSIMLDTNSIISLSMASSGAFSYNMACGFRDLANGHFIKGIGWFAKKIKAPALPINAKEEN